MSPRARLAHVSPGRLRLRVPDQRGEPDYFERVAEALAGRAGVDDVRANPFTASILLLHDGTVSAADLASQGEEQGLFRLERDPADAPLVDATAGGAAALDRWLLAGSRGTADLHSLLLVVLVGLSLVQLARGQVMGSASTLLWYAYDLVRERRAGAGGDGGDGGD